jgi:hypothetical protein
MKTGLLKLFFLFLCFNSTAQSEVGSGKNIKLIYDSSDLKKIIPEVDQLNADFEKKEHHKHYGIKQARAVYVRLGHINNLNAVHDLEKNMPLEKFIQKYPGAKVKRNVLVTQELNTDFTGNTINRFSYVDVLHDVNFESFDVYDKNDLPTNYQADSNYNYFIKDYDVKIFPKNYKNKVVYYFHGGYNNPEYNFIEAFYFLEDITTPEIPEPYSHMIDYTETIFDSSVKVYKEDYPASLRESMFLNKFPNDGVREVDSFMNIIRKMFNIKPVYNYYKYEAEIKKEINPVKIMMIRNKLSESPSLSILFDNAVNDALFNHHSDNIFEYLVGQLVSLEKELLIKQSRLPNRSCGNDNAPKIQDYTIADLALKTGNVKLFFNAHWYVMANRLDDEGFRKTYIEELIFSHVDPLSYCIGSYISHSGYNRARWNRYGKYYELNVIKNSSEIESIILRGISDNHLDNYNRLAMAKLFAVYCFNEKNKFLKQKNIDLLNAAIKNLPACIAFNYAKYANSIRKPFND